MKAAAAASAEAEPQRPSRRMMKTLIVLAKRPDAGVGLAVARGEHPRIEYLELQRRVGADLVDYNSIDSRPSLAVRCVKRVLGDRWALALLAALRARDYDNLYATGEDVGLPLAMMMRSMRLRRRLTLVVHNGDTPKRRALFRAVGHGAFKQVIALTSSQRELLVHAGRLPPEKVHFVPTWIDQRFFAPSAELPGDYALSVGMENRDYPTLFAAVVGLSSRFHVVGSGFSPGAGYAPAAGLRQQEGFSFSSGCSFRELRDLYQRARLVLVPVKPASYAAGVTCLLEGMSMGKAIVVADTVGLSDYVKPGVSAFVYRPGDASDLRRTLAQAWHDEARLREMGAHNRRWTETDINTDRYVETVAGLLGQ